MKDSIIVLAWPQTPAKAIGRWYDRPAELLGFLKDGYYFAGHAASVLIDHSNEECCYFDFGRYHMPRKYGRARSKETDPALTVHTKPVFSVSGDLLNSREILQELYNNQACHGSGPLYASVLKNVDFKSAYEYALSVQRNDAVKYGPYVINGTNCSRFITSVLKASKPLKKIKFRLSSSLLFTPLTKLNVFAVNNSYFKVTALETVEKRVGFIDLLKNFMLPFILLKEKHKRKYTIESEVSEEFNYETELNATDLNLEISN